MKNACEFEVGKMQKDCVMIPWFLDIFRIVKAKIHIFIAFPDCLLV